jgi:hypothetical protein
MATTKRRSEILACFPLKGMGILAYWHMLPTPIDRFNCTVCGGVSRHLRDATVWGMKE